MSQIKSGLGRGLDSLLQVEEIPNTLPVDQLRPNRWQPRSDFDDESLEELAASIRVQGIVQPLVVTTRDREVYTIVAGERRWRAARRRRAVGTASTAPSRRTSRCSTSKVGRSAWRTSAARPW